MNSDSPLRVGLLLFPRLTLLDAIAPHEVFARLPGVETLLIARSLDTVRSEYGVGITPTAAIADAPPLDVLCVPGGPGVGALFDDDVVLDYLAREAAGAKWVTSVCTGALALGAAGLLRGYRATTHWLSLDLLATCGAIPVAERVVRDRNRITGGGVTAGLDFALTLAAILRGEPIAQQAQLLLEYDPAPPFDAGSPARASAGIADAIRADRASLQRTRRESLEAAVRRRAPTR